MASSENIVLLNVEEPHASALTRAAKRRSLGVIQTVATPEIAKDERILPLVVMQDCGDVGIFTAQLRALRKERALADVLEDAACSSDV